MVSTGLSHEDVVTPDVIHATRSPGDFFLTTWNFLKGEGYSDKKDQDKNKDLISDDADADADADESNDGTVGAGNVDVSGRVNVPNICLFLLIFFSVPDTSATSYFYLTNRLHMSENVLSVINIAAMGTYVGGVLLYEYVLKDQPIEKTLRTATLVGAMVTASTLLLYTGPNSLAPRTDTP